MIIEDDGVSGIVAARVACRVVERLGKIIDHLAFAFVAPLGAHHANCLRSRLLSHLRRPHPSSGRTLPARVHNRSTAGGPKRQTGTYNPTLRQTPAQARPGCAGPN